MKENLMIEGIAYSFCVRIELKEEENDWFWDMKNNRCIILIFYDLIPFYQNKFNSDHIMHWII
jgi:hypothetical protein